jgi:hypothetical protein
MAGQEGHMHAEGRRAWSMRRGTASGRAGHWQGGPLREGCSSTQAVGQAAAGCAVSSSSLRPASCSAAAPPSSMLLQAPQIQDELRPQ